MIAENSALVELKNVGKSFRTAEGAERSVLEDVEFTLQEGEIVALLGKSGSGKSTLLRIMAGLIPADRGQVRYRGRPLYGPARGIAMVFQSFALFPWLTVQQNVELGLEAQGIPRAQRAERAEAAIDMIGLAGFEGALPRELSGGMRQRVGIARALVMNPDVLLMDEAFSALDVLTGETLRNDMLDLWDNGSTPMKGLLVVSHNIEEAVLMADRILIFSSDPGRVRVEIPIRLARPRNADSMEVRGLIDEVYAQMTLSPAELSALEAGEETAMHLGYRLPNAEVSQMEALLEMLADAPFEGHADLPQLAEESELSDHELLPVYEALRLLELVHIAQGDITLTALGRHYYKADQAQRQEIFGQQLLQHIPIAAEIRHSLEQEADGELPEEPFLRRMEEFMKEEEAERVLKVVIEWGRYGEVFEYDFHTKLLKLPEKE
ncbi:MAG: nitrate/sulfonate/bicarbonate ABC transporter ATP-binding protein [Propionivibrio sp.]